MEMHELYREIENEIEKLEKEGSTVQSTFLISRCTDKL